MKSSAEALQKLVLHHVGGHVKATYQHYKTSAPGLVGCSHSRPFKMSKRALYQKPSEQRIGMSSTSKHIYSRPDKISIASLTILEPLDSVLDNDNGRALHSCERNSPETLY
jgi:hypothetical protein